MSNENGLVRREETRPAKLPLEQIGMPKPEGQYSRGDYTANGLEIRKLGAPLSVRVISGDRLILTAEGTEKERKSVWCRIENGILVVGGGSKSSSGASVQNVVITSSGGGSTVVMGGVRGRVVINGVVMGGSEPESTLKVTIGVPKGCPIFLNGYSDRATIGDTEAPLKAEVKDYGNLRVGRISEAVLTASSHSEIKVASVSRTLVANIGGHSTIEINGGEIQACTFNASGHSAGSFKGTAQFGMLNASGHSNIFVAHVANQPLCTEDRYSNVRVGRIG